MGKFQSGFIQIERLPLHFFLLNYCKVFVFLCFIPTLTRTRSFPHYIWGPSQGQLESMTIFNYKFLLYIFSFQTFFIYIFAAMDGN